MLLCLLLVAFAAAQIRDHDSFSFFFTGECDHTNQTCKLKANSQEISTLISPRDALTFSVKNHIGSFAQTVIKYTVAADGTITLAGNMSFGNHNARDHTIIFHLTGTTSSDNKGFGFSSTSGNIIGGVGVYKNAGGIITSAGGGEGTKSYALISGHIWRGATEETETEKRTIEAQTTNQRGVDLIKSFEGWMACWYKDAAGYPTIGYGHLIKSGEPYKSGSCITQAQGETLLRNDLKTAENCVNNAVKRSINSNQFSALVSFTFNLGCGNFQSSTLLSKLNAGDLGAVCSELARWNKAGGKVLPGLTRRRAAECDLFRS